MTKINYAIPDRKYCSGDKVMFSARLPDTLVKELERVANQKGWSMTELLITAVDLYLQHETSAKSKRR